MSRDIFGSYPDIFGGYRGYFVSGGVGYPGYFVSGPRNIKMGGGGHLGYCGLWGQIQAVVEDISFLGETLGTVIQDILFLGINLSPWGPVLPSPARAGPHAGIKNSAHE